MDIAASRRRSDSATAPTGRPGAERGRNPSDRAEGYIVDYQCGWPEGFREVAGEMRAAFAGLPVLIEHVGSTSVPGLCAKPVIDILLGAQELLQVEERSAALAKLGYHYRAECEVEFPNRRYFVRPGDTGPRIHLHAVAAGSPF